MIKPDVFLKAVLNAEISFITGVPDSLLKDICGYISDNSEKISHKIGTNEGSAIAMAIGNYLATKNVPLIYMQNSGLGNIVNPITSSLSIYYEKTKSRYSKDIDHLVSFTKNGLWIKENLNNKIRIISADKPSGFELINVKIYHLKENSNLDEKIFSKTANIKDNNWILKDVSVFSSENGVITRKDLKSLKIESSYNYEKINSIFKNFNTLSFLDLINNYKKLIESGYNKSFLDQSLHTMLALPFFLFVMTALASIFTMNTLKKSNNYKLFAMALTTCVATFYFNDLSLALGKTERIPLVLSIWAPVLALSFFTFIGILQINEK